PPTPHPLPLPAARPIFAPVLRDDDLVGSFLPPLYAALVPSLPPRPLSRAALLLLRDRLLGELTHLLEHGPTSERHHATTLISLVARKSTRLTSSHVKLS